MKVRDEITAYVSKLTNEPQIDPSLNLFESGLLTSLDVLDLLAFIEHTFKIVVSGDDLGIENFGTIDKLTSFVEKSQGSADVSCN